MWNCGSTMLDESDQNISEFFEIFNLASRRQIFLRLGGAGENGLRFTELLNTINNDLYHLNYGEMSKDSFNKQMSILKKKHLITKTGKRHQDPFRLTDRGLIFYDLMKNIDLSLQIREPRIEYNYLATFNLPNEYTTFLFNDLPDKYFKKSKSNGEFRFILVDDKKLPIEFQNEITLKLVNYHDYYQIKLEIIILSKETDYKKAIEELRNFRKNKIIEHFIKYTILNVLSEIRITFQHHNLNFVEKIIQEINIISAKKIIITDLTIKTR